MILDLSRASRSDRPFPHFASTAALDPDVGSAALSWLRNEADWKLRIEHFYEQHEISLIDTPPSGTAAALVSPAFIDFCRGALERMLLAGTPLELVGVSAHRLTAGQTIRIHNDHVGSEESHRLLLQLNDGWSVERGGLLMLFEGDRPETLTDVLLPEHLSCFGFEISEKSHHAVSTISDGERFTVVYTFRRKQT